MAILLTDTFSPHPLIASEVVDGELVVLQLDDGIYYGLDQLGTLAWHRLSAGHTVASVARDVAARFPDVQPGRVCDDLVALTDELVGSRLLVRTRPER